MALPHRRSLHLYVDIVRESRSANEVAVLIGVASFFLMPQSPARTKSWWNPKGYFTEHEQKIIVNSGKQFTNQWQTGC